MRVVVADRDADHRRLLALALGSGSEGLEVVDAAADGRAAIEAVERCDADVLVLDVDLPGLDGLSVARELRERRPSCSCVFVTSVPTGELRGGGAVGAVSRSTPVSELAAAVRASAAAVVVVKEATTTVTVDDLAPRVARRFVHEVLDGDGHEEVLDTVQLLLSEVVTNAVMHARSDATVTVRVLDDVVRVEVVDGDDSFPVRRRAGQQPSRPGGRGLDLVERLSRSWGIDMLEVGKRTWFEVARS